MQPHTQPAAVHSLQTDKVEANIICSEAAACASAASANVEQMPCGHTTTQAHSSSKSSTLAASWLLMQDRWLSKQVIRMCCGLPNSLEVCKLHAIIVLPSCRQQQQQQLLLQQSLSDGDDA